MALPAQSSMALITGRDRVSQSTEGHPQSAGHTVAKYPLTRSQEGIWVDYLANRASTQYNISLEWNVVDNVGNQVKTGEIVAAIRELTRRHSILRSTVALLNGKPHIQEHCPKAAMPAIRLLASFEKNIPEQQLYHSLHEPFDLEHELLVRWYIIEQPSSTLLYLVSHHIALDGGGLTQLSVELFDVLAGNSHSPSQLSQSFSQAHLAEREWRLTEAYTHAETTCLNQLMGTFPFRWSKTPQHGPHDFRRLHTFVSLSKNELQCLSSRFSTSWFRASVSLVGLLLHIHTGATLDSDHSLAVSFGGRPAGFENTVGHFANPLPVKIPVQEHFLAEPGSVKNTLGSLVTSVSRNVSQVKRAERVSMLDLARAWRTKGRLGHFQSPQVAVSFAPALSDKRCRLFPVEGSWDLFFVFQDGPEGVELGVIYDPEIFNEEAMESMNRTYQALLELTKRESPVTLNDLPTMPTHLSLPLAQDPDEFVPVHGMFHMHAIKNPDRIALSCAERKETMSYGELDYISTLRAHVLGSIGVSAESVVILHLQRGFHLIEWILATLKAGGAYVYLDPKLPGDRKRLVISIASGKNSVLVTDDALPRDAEWAQVFSGTVVSHQEASELSRPDPEPAMRQVEPGNMAYIVFTSGSTGEPKGVMIEHGSFAHFVRSSVPMYGTGHGSRVLQLASFNFDASILEWSSALAAGGTLCFVEAPQALVGDYLADVIEQNDISFMQITPSALATVPLSRQLSSLRRVSVGGEAVPAQVLETWRERVPVINSYGPTETSVAVAFQEYTKGGLPIDQVSAGKPPLGTEIHICDPSFTQILPLGAEGEICIGGKSLGRGYCDRKALTEAKFAVHPTLGTRLYRSGDRGILLSDGSLVVHGRMDREIKIRGYRIAPEEIEKAIVSADNSVHGASVQVSSDGLTLIAVVTPDTCRADKVQSGISKTLPSHMRPSTILPVPSLPHNVSGKIDHNKVKENLGSYMRGATKMRQRPLNSKKVSQNVRSLTTRDAEIENSISKAWQEEIGLSDAPKVDVNFFDMGGHSHLVPRLHKRIASMYPSSKVTTLDLFYHSTIESQTRLLCERISSSDEQPYAEEVSQGNSVVDAGRLANAQEPADEHSLAIIGIAGKFPGADDPDELYANLTRGVSGIRESTTRTSAPKDCVWVPRAGTLSGIEEFDAKFWKLTREEAADMDPQQRLFLNMTLQALEDAGLDPFTDANNNIGVFVGAAANQYHTITDPVFGDPFQRANRGFVAPCLSARTAYHLNLHGPNVTINTNCASSTVAMALAVDALRSRRCDVAVVGGVSVQLFDGGYVTQPKNIFSLTGRCRPFEEEADGTVPSDAVVSVVLKRTADAVLDGDSAYALVVGAAYNSDGATNKVGYQVPSPRGQSDAIAAAWKNSRLSPEQLQYIELHGSGTPIGDALELEAIKLSLAKIGYPHPECLVGSNKGTLGNTQHASGLVSLIKICKSIQTGTIPAMVRTGKLNSFITDANLALDFAYQPTKVQPGALIGISAAGWGGVNSHMVVQVPPAELLKKMGKRQTKYQLCNEVLAAPRKSGLEGTELASPVHNDSAVDLVIREEKNGLVNGQVEGTNGHCAEVHHPGSEKAATATTNGVGPALSLVVQEVNKILGSENLVAADTDLRAAGFDSARFVRLAHSIRSAGNGFYLPVSSFIQPSLTPATLAATLETSQAFTSDSTVNKPPPCPLNKDLSSMWIQLQAGDQNADCQFILLPPSGGTCVALAALVTAMPAQCPVYGLEHPGHSTSLWDQDEYSVTSLAALYAGPVRGHLLKARAKKTVIMGASFGAVVATEILYNLSSFPDSSMILQNVQLVLLDAPAVSDFSHLSGHHTNGDVVTVNSNGNHAPKREPFSEDVPTEAVHRASIQALRAYKGPDAALSTGTKVLYVSARAKRSGSTNSEDKKLWWTRIFPKMQWEELESTHEELWRAKAADVLRLVQD